MKTLKLMQFWFLSLIVFLPSAVFAADFNDGTNDAAIQQDVMAKIARDRVVSGLDVKVESREGVVYLSGTTHTDKEASTLVEIAESAAGVKEVDTSNLTVEKSEHPLDDTYITAKVKGLFARHKLFGEGEGVPVTTISVETKNGVVHLTGTAKNQKQIDEAVRLAKTVKGVKSVRSKIKIEPTR